MHITMKSLTHRLLIIVALLVLYGFTTEAHTSETNEVAERAYDLFMSKKYSEAFPLMVKAAESGDGFSQFSLGTMYYKGLGTVADVEVARRWWWKAANNGITEANIWLIATENETYDDKTVTSHKNMDIAVVPEPLKRSDRHEKEGTFHNVEQMPTFPGGEAALMKWIDSHIQYPTMAQENNIQGSVLVQFVVTKTGQVGEVKVVRSVDKDLDREAVRVCKSLPKFVPGRQNGQAVNVWYTLPIIFSLNSITQQ